MNALLMLSRLDLRGFDGDLRDALSRDDAGASADALASVRETIADVRERGDAALRDLTERFDGCRVDELLVPPDELRAALDGVPPSLRTALEYAHGEIVAYHEAQRGPAVDLERDGVRLRELVVPVDRAGCYVPGGRATYPSSVLMTVTPARIAGVGAVALCTPPGPDGRIPSATLAAAAVAGADEVYRVGGAQAIAALAYGTETIDPVDVVVGPGNEYVVLAKREVAGVVGIESLAGQSEVAVVADDSSPPDLVAADLLAQAEHGPGGAAVLVTWSESVADAVDEWIGKLLADAPRRADIEQTLSTGGRAVLVDGPDAAMAAVNVIAPEHLQLMTDDPESLVPLVRNAGAVFCGPWSPAVVGDYVAGVNHVLPTARTARFASALRVDDFCKHVHVVRVDERALRRVAPYIEAIASAEGLAEHARSIELRVERG
jgi:histidinol dehydrogenase